MALWSCQGIQKRNIHDIRHRPGGRIDPGRQVVRGTSDMAGEVGHIRLERFGPVGYGKSGSWEGFCSGNGIAQLARIKALERFQLGETVSFAQVLMSWTR